VTTFIFDHIPKTGGSAFKSVLEQIFGAENVSPAVSGRSELWAEQKYAGYRVITGHFHSPIPRGDRTNRRARITMLRHPVDRAISEYYYYRNDVERVEWNRLAILAKDHDLYCYAKLLEARKDMAISNFYSRRFASQLSRQLWGDRKVLQLAKAALARYDFVGIQENFVDSVDLFCCEFGLPPILETPRVNVTSSRTALQELDSTTYDQLVKMNRLDIELYEHALSRFQAKKRHVFHRLAGNGASEMSLSEVSEWAQSRELNNSRSESFGDLSVEICSTTVVGRISGTQIIRPGEYTAIRMTIEAHIEVPELTVGIEISDELGEIVFGTNTYLLGRCQPVSRGHRYEIAFSFVANLKHGQYFVGGALHTGATHEERCFHWCDRLTSFDVADDMASDFVGYCRLAPDITWSTRS
jgi:hypothetical protein